MKKTFLAIILVLAFLLCSCSGGSDTKRDCSVGESIIIDDLTISLTNVKEYVDDADFAPDTPDEGYMYVILSFEIKNTGEEDDFFNSLYEDSYCDNKAIDTTLLWNYDGDEAWGEVAVGRERSGYVAYELPVDWETLEMIYSPNIWDEDEKYTFIINRSDMQ